MTYMYRSKIIMGQNCLALSHRVVSNIHHFLLFIYHILSLNRRVTHLLACNKRQISKWPLKRQTLRCSLFFPLQKRNCRMDLLNMCCHLLQRMLVHWKWVRLVSINLRARLLAMSFVLHLPRNGFSIAFFLQWKNQKWRMVKDKHSNAL